MQVLRSLKNHGAVPDNQPLWMLSNYGLAGAVVAMIKNDLDPAQRAKVLVDSDSLYALAHNGQAKAAVEMIEHDLSQAQRLEVLKRGCLLATLAKNGEAASVANMIQKHLDNTQKLAVLKEERGDLLKVLHEEGQKEALRDIIQGFTPGEKAKLMQSTPAFYLNPSAHQEIFGEPHHRWTLFKGIEATYGYKDYRDDLKPSHMRAP